MRTSTFATMVILIIVLAAGAIFLLGKNKNTGTVAVESFADCLAAGFETTSSTPRECETPDGRTFREEDGEPVPGQDKSDLIRVTSPAPNATIESPLTVEGEARGYWFFEASFPVRVLDGNGNELAVVPAQAEGEWMTEDFVPFRAVLSLPTPLTETGTVVFEKDNPSGLPEHADEVRIPVRFAKTLIGETMDVTVFFSNPEQLGDGEFDCAAVLPVKRTVPKSEAVAREALEALFVGPTVSERQAGYVTTIPQGVRIKSLAIQDSTARVDVSKELEPGGGSCAVTAIRAQIEKTLKQFSTIKTVVISVDGRTDDILQP